MAVKAFKTWYTYYDVAQELSPKDQGTYYRAIMDYMFADIDREDELPKLVKIAFKSVKGNLKRSKSNKRGEEIGNESGTNRETEDDTENALTLTLTSTLTSKEAGAGSGRGRPAPAKGLPESVAFPCPYCKQETVAKYSEAMGSYSVQCKCGADFAMSPGAVALAIERAES